MKSAKSDFLCLSEWTAPQLDAILTLTANLKAQPQAIEAPPAAETFEASVAGTWVEPEHGDVLHRYPTRLASFSWRAHGVAQGLCTWPDDGHLAEWQNNLTGRVRFLGDAADAALLRAPQRRLLASRIETFDGGFVTSGSWIEGVSPQLEEGWQGRDMATDRKSVV